MSIAKDDFDDLRYAKALLENSSLAARISNLLGNPIGTGFEHLPAKWKGVVQAIPLVGAAGGALINTIFIDHFQNMARGHFIIRRLERLYDNDLIKQEYDKLDL